MFNTRCQLGIELFRNHWQVPVGEVFSTPLLMSVDGICTYFYKFGWHVHRAAVLLLLLLLISNQLLL